MFFSNNFALIVTLHDDIEYNPGPKKKELPCFPFCHWNVNSFVGHNKISLSAAHKSVYRHDISNKSEIFLDSIISDDDNILHLMDILFLEKITLIS